jgi:uncharacterized coiled-coil protein SlyX
METTTETCGLNLENKEIGTVEIKIEEPTLNNEEIKANVTLKSQLIASLKTKLSYVYNKFMKLVSCTTNAVDTTHEPTTLIEELINIKEPVIEKVEAVVEALVEALVEEAAVEEATVKEAILEQPPLDPVLVEQPVSIEERM